MNLLFDVLTCNFPFASETVCLAMALQGAVAVRNGPNRTGHMHWFHAFLRSTLTAYAGATFTNIFLGRPTRMLSDDVFFGSCVVAYAIVNYLPFDAGYQFCNTFVGSMLTTVFSQIFRMGGVSGFSDAAYNAFKDAPSAYYPTPVFGPILFPVALGNMGGFLWTGFDAYLEDGMPWLFQQGIACSTFYHFYAHDAAGSVGVALRAAVRPAAIQVMLLMGAKEKESEDDALFAKFAVGLFMALMGILRMPQVLGPRFSPFTAVGNVVTGVLGGKKRKVDAKPPSSGKKSKKKKQ